MFGAQSPVYKKWWIFCAKILMQHHIGDLICLSASNWETSFKNAPSRSCSRMSSNFFSTLEKKFILKLIEEDTRTAKKKVVSVEANNKWTTCHFTTCRKKAKRNKCYFSLFSFRFYIFGFTLGLLARLCVWLCGLSKKETTACFHFLFSCSYISMRTLFGFYSCSFGIAHSQSSIKCGVSSQRNLCHFFGS